MTAIEELWNRSGKLSSGTYPVNSIFGFAAYFFFIDSTYPGACGWLPPEITNFAFGSASDTY